MLCMESALSRALFGRNSGANVQEEKKKLAVRPRVLLRLLRGCVGTQTMRRARTRLLRGEDPSKGSTRLCGLGLRSVARTSVDCIRYFASHRRELQRSILHTICTESCRI